MKHNKIRNTGVLFELLVRRIAADVLEGNSDSFAIRLVQEHFHPKSELGKELQLYRAFFTKLSLSENKAYDILNMIVQKRQSINERLLMSQKFMLIREIKANCDLKQFMSGRIPSYKVYASIYKLFESLNDEESLTELEDVISSKFVIIEHLTGNITEEPIAKETALSEAIKGQSEEIRYLSYKILLERFNEKYSVFDEKQKNLLREFINNGTDVRRFNAFVHKEVSELINSLEHQIRFVSNEVTRIKLNEVIVQLKNIASRSTIKEHHITSLLIAYQINTDLHEMRNS